MVIMFNVVIVVIVVIIMIMVLLMIMIMSMSTSCGETLVTLTIISTANITVIIKHFNRAHHQWRASQQS